MGSVAEQLDVVVQPDDAVHGVVARVEKVTVQFGVAVRVVVAHMGRAIDFEVARCSECQMKVVTFVVVVVTTADERVVALATSSDKTARQDWGEFVLRCLSVRHYDFERC